jgi:hypothetical protein
MSELDYRYYFTELVRLYVTKGATYAQSLYDIEHPAEQETRTAEEIATEVIENAGLEVVDGPA